MKIKVVGDEICYDGVAVAKFYAATKKIPASIMRKARDMISKGIEEEIFDRGFKEGLSTMKDEE